MSPFCISKDVIIVYFFKVTHSGHFVSAAKLFLGQQSLQSNRLQVEQVLKLLLKKAVANALVRDASFSNLPHLSHFLPKLYIEVHTPLASLHCIQLLNAVEYEACVLTQENDKRIMIYAYHDQSMDNFDQRHYFFNKLSFQLEILTATAQREQSTVLKKYLKSECQTAVLQSQLTISEAERVKVQGLLEDVQAELTISEAERVKVQGLLEDVQTKLHTTSEALGVAMRIVNLPVVQAQRKILKIFRFCKKKLNFW